MFLIFVLFCRFVYLLRHILGNNIGKNWCLASSDGKLCKNFLVATDDDNRTYIAETSGKN